MHTHIAELTPRNGQRSFYGKAIVIHVDGVQYLQSYKTVVASVSDDGTLHRHWAEWTATTGRHIASFAEEFTGKEVRKAQFVRLPLEDIPDNIKRMLKLMP